MPVIRYIVNLRALGLISADVRLRSYRNALKVAVKN